VSDVHVTIAYVHQNDVGAAFTESVLRMISYDKNVGGGYLLHESGFDMAGAILPLWGRGGDLAFFRNVGAASFLATDSDYLLWVDSDMGFPADALERLMRIADPIERPIVGGLCFVEQLYTNDFTGGLITSLAPTIYDWVFLPSGDGYKLQPRTDYERNAITRVAATGTGFLLTHRSVFEKISDWCVAGGAPGNIWYERIPGPTGQPSGEDISFCMRANQLGIPIHVDTGTKITHQKTVWLREADYDHRPIPPSNPDIPLLPPDEWPRIVLNRNAPADAARKGKALATRIWPTASERTLILVPVMKRPHSAITFMTSLRASLEDESMVTVLALTDRYDVETAQAWYAQGAMVDSHTYHPHPGRPPAVGGTFAQKINRGYSEYVEGSPIGDDYRWIFVVGDDVTFHPGWLDAAQYTAHSTGKAVIGTNDLGSELVRTGQHATHMLLRTGYVFGTGAGWDGPGVVCHEGYGHWYVDNEIIDAAKQRDQWAPCLDSVVEHNHPIFGRGREDAVYQLGQSSARVDGELFALRSAAYANHPTTPEEN
jgi:hypothetical protein